MIRNPMLTLVVALTVGTVGGWVSVAQSAETEPPADLILHNGKILTVDDDFSIVEAIAVRAGRILKVGTNAEVLKTRGDQTEVRDLAGKMVLPGLIDSHVHPSSAAMHEFDHEIPDMHSIEDVLAYIRHRAEILDEGEWIVLRQVFITRLAERRYPTKAEMDQAAPKHPVLFSTGPDASVNSLALKLSGIDKDFQVTGNGQIEKDPETGEPTGILRAATRYVKSSTKGKSATEQDRYDRLLKLFHDYSAVGITAICDRGASAGSVGQMHRMETNGDLPLRVSASWRIGTDRRIDAIQEQIREIAEHPLTRQGEMVRIIGVKTFLDGGMLTGSAFMRRPWGESEIYSITDPSYRGLQFIPREQLLPIVQATVDAGLQFTAHSVGDGAVHLLLDVYEEVNQTTPIRETTPCITHSNFMSREAVEQAAKLGVVADIQPAWLYLDAETLRAQFGDQRLRYFQPLKTAFEAGMIVGGGSDHMQKIGSFRSVNPYNPFLGIAVTIARTARDGEQPLHPVESLSREQAIRFYTANNAQVIRREEEIGTLEPGKFADLIVIDRDLLTCDVGEIPETQVLTTYLSGRPVKAGQTADTAAGQP